MEKKIFVDFKGKRFYPPFKCLCCGKDISVEQFCYGRTCGYCDCGRCNLGLVNGKEILFEIGHGRKDIFEDAENVPLEVVSR